MKKIALLGFFVIILNNLIAQKYFPFPTENAKWNILRIYGLNEEPVDTTILRYSLGDTISSNGEIYRYLLKESGDTINPLIDTVGSIREKDKVVYFSGRDYLDFFTEYEYILYDFTKNIGDTILHDSLFGVIKSVILDIDSIQINGEYRKRYKIDNSLDILEDIQGPEYWVEGIGSIKRGLLGPISMWPLCCYHYWEHICYTENNELLYKNPIYDNCYPFDLQNSIGNLNSKENIQLYPNPINEILNINGLDLNKENTIEIFNSIGVVIYSEKVKGINFIKLDFNYPSGFYIIRITDNNKKNIKSAKLVK